MTVSRYSFGTGPERARFGVRSEGDRVPSWTAPEVNARTFVIPGSTPPRSETQIVSIGPSTLTWRLWFPTLDAYWAMLARLGTTDVLTVVATVQSHKGTYREAPGGGVVDLPNTILLALDADSPRPDGHIEAVATFMRHIDPATGEVVSS